VPSLIKWEDEEASDPVNVVLVWTGCHVTACHPGSSAFCMLLYGNSCFTRLELATYAGILFLHVNFRNAYLFLNLQSKKIFSVKIIYLKIF
jgi:hypothetical protein